MRKASWRRWVPVALVALMLGLSAASALAPRPEPNTFFFLWLLAFPVIAGAGVTALRSLIADRRNAPGVLGAMLYALALALGFIWATFSWGATDNAFLGLLELALLLLLFAVPLGLASAIMLLGGRGPETEPALRRALLAALGATVFTLVWFVWRGPGDWATASGSATLFSFPLVVAACMLGLLIVQTGRPQPPP